MKTVLLNILVLFVLSPFLLVAQPSALPDSLLGKLAGKWVLNGAIEGKETTHDVEAAWVLEHQYLQITEVSREKDANGRPEYSAIVYLCWEQKAQQYSCLWLDNTGNTGLSAAAMGHAKPDGDKIALIFKTGGGSSFCTTFTYNRAENSWLWSMDAEDNGKTENFARVKLTPKQLK